jgi:hypothetical protein
MLLRHNSREHSKADLLETATLVDLGFYSYRNLAKKSYCRVDNFLSREEGRELFHILF